MPNKSILISGGVTGIGAATALHFLELGWHCSVFSDSKSHNKKFKELVRARDLDHNLLVLEADITKEQDVKKVVAETNRVFGRIDILFNNAGMGYFVSADKVNIKKFDEMMEVNMVGLASLTKAVIPIMKKQKHGLIINNASTAAKAGHAKSEFYAASKSAVLLYSEGLRAELEKFGIKVSVICTKNVKTNFWDKHELARRKKEVWRGKLPAFLSPEDIARLVWFMAVQPEGAIIEEATILPFGK